MKNLKFQIFFHSFLILVFIGCEEKSVTEQNQDFFIGTWVNPQITDSLVTYSKSNDLVENNYGIAFLSDGTLIERKNSGWCGTPPISYSDFEGTWTQTDSIINITVSYWGGSANYQWKLVDIKDNKFVVYKIKEEYDFENGSSLDSPINTVEIKYGECVTTYGQMTLCFDSLLEDSRCPKGAMCVWEGNAEVKLRLSINGIGEHYIQLNTNKKFPTDTTINDLNISLISLTPHPDISIAIRPEDYIVKLSVANLKTIVGNAQILSFNPEKSACGWGWTIKMDNDTIKSDDYILGETIGYEITEPIDVYIEPGVKERDCSIFGMDYYEIKRIIEVE